MLIEEVEDASVKEVLMKREEILQECVSPSASPSLAPWLAHVRLFINIRCVNLNDLYIFHIQIL